MRIPVLLMFAAVATVGCGEKEDTKPKAEAEVADEDPDQKPKQLSDAEIEETCSKAVKSGVSFGWTDPKLCERLLRGNLGDLVAQCFNLDPSDAVTAKCVTMGTRKPILFRSFKGSGKQSTRPFNIMNNWEIRWNDRGGTFSIELKTASGGYKGLVANQIQAGQGASYQPEAGEYYLEISGMGDWAVEVWVLVDK
jgi:hypothetical protein